MKFPTLLPTVGEGKKVIFCVCVQSEPLKWSIVGVSVLMFEYVYVQWFNFGVRRGVSRASNLEENSNEIALLFGSVVIIGWKVPLNEN